MGLDSGPSSLSFVDSRSSVSAVVVKPFPFCSSSFDFVASRFSSSWCFAVVAAFVWPCFFFCFEF